jgi:hypothetical protein
MRSVQCGGLTPRPSGDLPSAKPSVFAPAADLLFAPPKSRQKALPCKTAPAGCPAMLEAQGPCGTPSATLRSNSRTESEVEARRARALGFCASRRFRRGGPKHPNSRQSNPQAGWRRLFLHPPFSAAEERSGLRPRVQHASSSDSARLFDRSVAKGVPRGVASREHRREPGAKRRAARSGATFCLLFGRSKRRSPAGANSRHGPGHSTTATVKLRQ